MNVNYVTFREFVEFLYLGKNKVKKIPKEIFLEMYKQTEKELDRSDQIIGGSALDQGVESEPDELHCKEKEEG